MNTTFDPQTLADDLDEDGRIYARFFAALHDAGWDKPVKGGTKEWTLHETIAHLCALNGAGLEEPAASGDGAFRTGFVTGDEELTLENCRLSHRP